MFKKLKNKKRLFVLSLILAFLSVAVNFANADYQAPRQPSLREAVTNVFWWGIGIAGILAGISFAWGAVVFIISGANPTAKNDAKDRMLGSLLGLVLLFSSWLIMHTINPEIEKLEITGTISSVGIYYSNGNEKDNKPAPMTEADTSYILNLKGQFSGSNYTKIQYKCPGNITTGTPLLVWFYPETYFKDSSGDYSGTKIASVPCGQETAIEGASFKISFQWPGIYFYTKSGCQGYMSEAFTSDQSSIPEPFSGNIKSIAIINNIKYPDSGYTDFMAIFRDKKNLSGLANCTIPIYSGPNGQRINCVNISQNYTNSVYIRNLNDDTSRDTGLGMIFYSKPWGWQTGSFAGRKESITNGSTVRSLWMNYQPGQLAFTHSSEETQKYKSKCANFASCPGSVQILGNYLVVLSANSSYGTASSATSAWPCQIFSSNINSVKETEFSAKENTIGRILAIPLK